MVNDEYNICFHIGYPKSASTSLQSNVFSVHSEINFFGKRKNEFKSFYDKLKFQYKDDPIELEYFNLIKPNLSKNKINLFSDEGLLDQFNDYSINNSSKAFKIKRYFPNSKIIIVIRNQADLLRSHYDYEIPDYSVNAWLRKKIDNFYINGDRYLDSLKFDKTISLYHQIFGKNKVKVLLFEELKFNPNEFATKISDFLDISKEEIIIGLNMPIKNSAVTNKKSKVNQYRNKRFNHLKNNLNKNWIRKYFSNKMLNYSVKLIDKMLNVNFINSKIYSINSVNLEKINKIYNESNTKLNNILDIDINQYNYPI